MCFRCDVGHIIDVVSVLPVLCSWFMCLGIVLFVCFWSSGFVIGWVVRF